MAGLSITWADIEELQHFEKMLRGLSSQQVMHDVARRAINRTGDMAKTQVVRALTSQTGLKRSVIVKAVKVKRANFDSLKYEMTTVGGEVALKYFNPRETRKGVTAKPFGKRRVYPGAFMKAGWFPKRVRKANWHGQVFMRTGEKTSTGQDEFEKVKSGVTIPVEMVRGETADAFRQSVKDNLPRRVAHELSRATGGALR